MSVTSYYSCVCVVFSAFRCCYCHTPNPSRKHRPSAPRLPVDTPGTLRRQALIRSSMGKYSWSRYYELWNSEQHVSTLKATSGSIHQAHCSNKHLIRSSKHNDAGVSTTAGDKVSMITHPYPHKSQRKWISAITRLTVHYTCDLMSDVVICKHRIECGHTWHWLSLLKPSGQLRTQTQCWSLTVANSDMAKWSM